MPRLSTLAHCTGVMAPISSGVRKLSRLRFLLIQAFLLFKKIKISTRSRGARNKKAARVGAAQCDWLRIDHGAPWDQLDARRLRAPRVLGPPPKQHESR